MSIVFDTQVTIAVNTEAHLGRTKTGL